MPWVPPGCVRILVSVGMHVWVGVARLRAAWVGGRQSCKIRQKTQILHPSRGSSRRSAPPP
eukprot:76181-Prymnesium_polylepis.1